MGGSDAFGATAFMNTTDTNHVQVISLGRKLNLLISLEVSAPKKCLLFCWSCFTYSLSDVFIIFCSSPNRRQNAKAVFLEKTDCGMAGLH